MLLENHELDQWERVKSHIKTAVGSNVYEAWFLTLRLEKIDDKMIHLSVTNRFLKRWIEEHYITVYETSFLWLSLGLSKLVSYRDKSSPSDFGNSENWR